MNTSKTPTTVLGGTMTSEGFIPHRRSPGGVEMPVALDFPIRMSLEVAKRFAPPARCPATGSLLFVLPGGQRTTI